MPSWSKNIILAVLAFFVGANLFAQIPDGGHDKDNALNLSGGSIITAVPFLLISPDARGGSLGDGGVASSPDINSQHWNAAKYAFIDDYYGASLTYSPWLRVLVPDMNLLYLAGYYRLDDDWAFGGSMRYFSLGRVVFRNSADDQGITHHPNEYAFDLSLSRKLSDHFSLALTGRYIRSDLTSGYTDPLSTQKASAANAGAVDISMFYTREITTPNTDGSSVALGLSISNVGTRISYSSSMAKDFLPANLRLGAAYTVQLDRYNEITGMLDFNKLLVPTGPIWNTPRDSIIAGIDDDVTVMQGIFQSFYDAPGGFREELQEINISAGVEYVYNKVLAVRGGYFYENKHKGGRQYFTLGAGLKLNVLEIDFSYLLPRGNNPANATNPLKNTLRFTLKFNFAEYMRSRQNP